MYILIINYILILEMCKMYFRIYLRIKGLWGCIITHLTSLGPTCLSSNVGEGERGRLTEAVDCGLCVCF